MCISRHLFTSKAHFVQIIISFFALHSFMANATGMVPETSMLYVNEAEQGASMNIKNTDPQALLLYTSINDLPDDTGTHLLVTQPVVRVEGGQTQHIRFILQTDKPLKVEHMKRVVYEGIPQKKKGQDRINFHIRQDLPVLIHPAGLPEGQNPWTQLTWKAKEHSIMLSNATAYVVRFQPAVVLLPSNTLVKLPKSYILPGQTITANTGDIANKMTTVKFSPVSRYGAPVGNITAPIQTQ
jgi:P pilus assembly chaperone PapD